MSVAISILEETGRPHQTLHAPPLPPPDENKILASASSSQDSRVRASAVKIGTAIWVAQPEQPQSRGGDVWRHQGRGNRKSVLYGGTAAGTSPFWAPTQAPALQFSC